MLNNFKLLDQLKSTQTRFDQLALKLLARKIIPHHPHGIFMYPKPD